MADSISSKNLLKTEKEEDKSPRHSRSKNSKRRRHRRRHRSRSPSLSKSRRKKSARYSRKSERSSSDKNNKKEQNFTIMSKTTKSSLWDQTPTEAQRNSFNLENLNSLVVKMPDGTFANVPTLLGKGTNASGIQSKVSPGTLNTATHVIDVKRQARRILVSNLPSGTTKETLRKSLENAFENKVEKTKCPNIISIVLNQTQHTAYVELSSEEAVGASLELNGKVFDGSTISVQRLTASAIASSALNNLTQSFSSAVPIALETLSGCGGAPSRHVPDGPGKIFCAGVPVNLGEGEIIELLSTYGKLKEFFLPQDSMPGKSRGFCFFRYEDIRVTNEAVKGLHGIQIEDNTLTVKLHTVPNREDPAEALRKAQKVLIAAAESEKTGKKSRVLCMLQMVTEEDLQNEEEFKEIMEDIRDECKNYGKVVSLRIPRPGDSCGGLGKVFVKFKTHHEAATAKGSLEGRTFEKRVVLVQYYNEKKFDKGEFGKDCFTPKNSN